MKQEDFIPFFNKYSKNRDRHFTDIQDLLRQLPGFCILFTRGKTQTVYARIEEFVPHTLKIRITNLETHTQYEQDVTKIQIHKILRQLEDRSVEPIM